MQKVIVAFEQESTAASICEALESGGVAECVSCRSAAEVRRLVNKQGISVIVCGFKFPDGSGEDLYYDLPQHCVMLMIAAQNRLEMCEAEGIFRLPAPVSWTFQYTAGVPCDSFQLRCIWEGKNAARPAEWASFQALEGGEVVFTGVVDEETWQRIYELLNPPIPASCANCAK